MKAAWYERNGAARDVMQVGQQPTPEPQAGQVRVALHCSGVNPSDVKSRMARPLGGPLIIPHSDGAGVIDAVGQGVDSSRIGQRVWTWNAQWQRPMGTAAQFVCLPSVQAVELADHVLQDDHLLRVLLPEEDQVRLRYVEELAHHRRHAWRPRAQPQPLGRRGSPGWRGASVPGAIPRYPPSPGEGASVRGVGWLARPGRPERAPGRRGGAGLGPALCGFTLIQGSAITGTTWPHWNAALPVKASLQTGVVRTIWAIEVRTRHRQRSVLTGSAAFQCGHVEW